MARDYGHRRPVKQKSSAPQQVLMMAFSFILGYFAATVFDAQKLTQWMNSELLAPKEKAPRAPKPVAHKTEPPKPKFEFYTLLANEKGVAHRANSTQAPTNAAPVVPSNPAPTVVAKTTETPPVEAPKTHAPVNKSNFLVQVAAFKVQKDAEQMKALLTLKGYDVNVVAISQAQGNWFRVVVGPYQNKSLAQEAQATLAKNERLKGMLTSVAG